MKGPWPQPGRHAVRERARAHPLAHPAWGHRKIWAMVRHEGHVVSEATVLRLLRDERLILPAACQRERRNLAQRRKAAFAAAPTGGESGVATGLQASIENTTGGVWRIAGCREDWSTYEHRFHISTTANQREVESCTVV